MYTPTWKVMLMLVATSAVSYSRGNKAELEYRVDVCAQAMSLVEFSLAKGRVSAMFADIGVRIAWHPLGSCPEGALKITFSQSDAKASDTALGYALPYEGTHIVVLLDRIREMVPPVAVPALLGHVMAHEITHILEGYSRHSESGLMKAHWEGREFKTMETANGLLFAPEDVETIHRGLQRRERTAAVMTELR